MSATLPRPTTRGPRAAAAAGALSLLAAGLVAVAGPAAAVEPSAEPPAALSESASLPMLTYTRTGDPFATGLATQAYIHAQPHCEGSRVELSALAATGWGGTGDVQPVVEDVRAGGTLSVTALVGGETVQLGSWVTPPSGTVVTTRDDLAPYVTDLRPGYVIANPGVVWSDAVAEMPVLSDTVAVWPSQFASPSESGGWISPQVGVDRAIAYVLGDPSDPYADPASTMSGGPHTWVLEWDIAMPAGAETITLDLARTDGVVETATALVPEFDPETDCGGEGWPPAGPLPEFGDVTPGAPFHEEITWLAYHGITKGYEDGSFGSVKPVSRAAMAAFLYRFAGVEGYTPPAEPIFADVPTTDPFYTEISWLAEEQITAGYDADTFGPLRPVSRGAMAAFLFRFAEMPLEYGLSSVKFPDVPDDGPFAVEIGWLADNSIATGYADGTYGPLRPVSRGAMAAFLFRMAHTG